MTTAKAAVTTAKAAVTTRPTLTVVEAAEYLSVTPRFVRTLVQERRITSYKLGRFVRLTTDDLDAFVQAGRVELWRS